MGDRRWSAEQIRNHRWLTHGVGNPVGGFRRTQSAAPKSIFSNQSNGNQPRRMNNAMMNLQNFNAQQNKQTGNMPMQNGQNNAQFRRIQSVQPQPQNGNHMMSHQNNHQQAYMQ